DFIARGSRAVLERWQQSTIGTVCGELVGVRHDLYFQDEQAAALAMRAGAIDGFIAQDPRSFGGRAGSSVKITVTPAKYTQGIIAMNWKVAPYDDVHVRRAIAYAINRAGIVAAFTRPRVPPAAHAAAPSHRAR